MNEKRHLSATIEIELRGDAKKPVIRGLAAVYYDGTEGTEFELWPGMKERIMPGAFDRAVKEDDVRALFNHDDNIVLGRTKSGTLRLSVDAKGLRYEIEPPESAASVIESIRRGDVSGSSFSFRVTDETFLKKDDVRIREIRGVTLFDVSPVVFPAYTATEADVRSISERAEKSLGKPDDGLSGVRTRERELDLLLISSDDAVGS